MFKNSEMIDELNSQPVYTVHDFLEGYKLSPRKILVLGASYGSLLGAKVVLAGHDVTLVCLPAEADLINAKGAIVRMPVKGRDGLCEVNSRALPGKLRAERIRAGANGHAAPQPGDESPPLDDFDAPLDDALQLGHSQS